MLMWIWIMDYKLEMMKNHCFSTLQYGGSLQTKYLWILGTNELFPTFLEILPSRQGASGTHMQAGKMTTGRNEAPETSALAAVGNWSCGIYICDPKWQIPQLCKTPTLSPCCSERMDNLPNLTFCHHSTWSWGPQPSCTGLPMPSSNLLQVWSY